METKTKYGLGGGALGYLFGGLDMAAVGGILGYFWGDRKEQNMYQSNASQPYDSNIQDIDDVPAYLDGK